MHAIAMSCHAILPKTWKLLAFLKIVHCHISSSSAQPAGGHLGRGTPTGNGNKHQAPEHVSWPHQHEFEQEAVEELK